MEIKSLIAAFTLSLGLQAQAASMEAGVYCDPEGNGNLVNILSGDWDTCTTELMLGQVCYEGSREAVIQILNSPEVREKFNGTDGEYIKRAFYHGKNLVYTSVDEKNASSSKHVIEECN
ncbi:MAG: hypothetical protein ACLGGX_03400 [Bdellovibrionia bacterium]